MNLEFFKSKKVILFAAAAVVVLAAVSALFCYTWSELAKSRQALEAAQKKYGELKALEQSAEKIEAEKKFVKSEFDKYSRSLPAVIVQERAFDSLNRMAAEAGVDLLNVNFTAPDSKSAGDGISLICKITFSGYYSNITGFVGALENSPDKIVLEEISLNGAQGIVNGSAKVVFYGYKKSSYQPGKWESSLLGGKDDLFSSIDGEAQAESPVLPPDASQPAAPVQTPQAQKAPTPYDLFAVLNPRTDDAPSFILGKNNVPGSEIYYDGDGDSWANLYFTQKDGKPCYRYRTEFGCYPAGNSVEEFIPAVPGAITVKVTSKPRSAGDNSVMRLNVINNSGLKVEVISNVEEGLPRLIVNPVSGAVFTRYE